MSARGFTLVELLVAVVVLLLVAGAAYSLVGPARAAFDLQPGAIDMRQRGRAGLAAVSRAVLEAGGDVGMGEPSRALASLMPVLWPLGSLDGLDEDGDLHALLTIAAVIAGGQARLAQDQSGPAGFLQLEIDEGRPAAEVVCGFAAGALVAIVDLRGRFDLFEIGSVSAAAGRIMPMMPLARAYRASARLIEVDATRAGLRTEPDGSRTLVRTTWAGAVEPIVDGVVSMQLRVLALAAPPEIDEAAVPAPAGLASYGPPPPGADDVDPDGVWPDGEHCAVTRDTMGARSRFAPWAGATDLVELRLADLLDGPWCPHPFAADAYDADLFRVREVQLVLRIEAPFARLRGPAGPLFARAGHADPTRWLPDRELVVSLGRR
jgi:prepilin-type N-terminal cleavage/methylation domain-containing protein